MAYSAAHSSRFSASAPLPTTPLARRDSARTAAHPSLQQQLFGPSAAGPSAPPSIIDRPLAKTRGAEVAMGAWAFMFAEIVAYSQSRVDSVSDLEARLSSLGYDAGQRLLPLLLLRNTQASGIKEPKREHRLIPILQFIHTQVYRYCFGRAADGLERSVEEENEYMITLNQPPLTQFISVPKDMSQLSCEAYTAGIVEGVLDGLDVPARVTAHTVPTDAFPQRTVILIKLDQKVMDREEALGK
ncbi:BET3 family protein [Cryptococcus neoformans]|uniref:Trafficking protein particle complex subunit n=2 Tax=Cryptococcus neoformans TaxID=5207 RepID=A0A854QNJ9_CRYNE|nr:BET3 family protein [Cryptococcus neoformans var. grubii H99]AUB22682.1 BET3 family protein [Cryptococcus neoformans var. grubii]OWT42143.1 BET3 family protein [Cryptococcus neoformans var. grubii Bt1]OWZ52074.1 BET3 family protein [Cryptococcus neoformans var. grubii AD1-83a]OWZ80166.1 BET3 family protein [Cryptococcus neoformans var. grubii Bt85]OXG27786.1 BET3 family protein [Cryptococcus neoformans var. grubii Tu259-1]OXG53156.1 BET3 family protein [Cryptococcus neoformans var. grubii |eukprot:XP_012047377.1 BET3 family protein [Cryptococcus neoformans var. grubii H99]